MAEEDENTPVPTQANLNTLIGQARDAVDRINQTETQAGELLGRIDENRKNIETIQATINTKLNEIQNNAQLSETEKTKIQTIREQVNDTLEQSKIDLEQVKSNVQEIQDTYTSFTEVKGQVFDSESGLQAILTLAKQKLDKIETHRNSAEALLKTVQEKLDTTSGHIDEIEAGYTRFTELDAKVTDEENGLEAVLTWAQETKTAIGTEKDGAEKLRQQISDLRDQSNIAANSILDTEKQAKTTLGQIKDHEEASEITRGQIEKILGLVTDRGLAHAFSLRSKNLSTARWIWLCIFVSSLFSIGLVVYLIFRDAYLHHPELLERGYIWFRIAGASPLAFLAFFAGSQYSKERDLLERYAFKESAALGLESYTNLLTRIFNDEKYRDIILTFVLDGMTKIYEEPYEPWKQDNSGSQPTSRLERWRLNVYDKLEQTKGVEFSEKTETTIKTAAETDSEEIATEE